MTLFKQAAVFAGLTLILAAPHALAFSTESGPVNADGSSQMVDPDDQLEDMNNPPPSPNVGDTWNLGTPIGNDGSLSTFWGTQPDPAGGLPGVPGDAGN